MLKKSYLIILGYFLVLIAIPAIFYLFQDQIKTNFFKSKMQVQPKLIQESTLVQIATESHPEVFYANLEYDPKTGVVTQYGVSKTNGDPPLLLGEKPKPDPKRFTYKITVLSKDNIGLQSGWYSTPLEIVKTPQNTFRFDAVASYEPEAILQIEIDNKNVWAVKMQ